MKKIRSIVRPEVLEDIKAALKEIDIHGVTVTQVMGCGRQLGWEQEIDTQKMFINILPKMQVSIVTSDDMVDTVIDTIVSASKTGKIGDGKIFVTEYETAIRIRTGQNGDDALIQ